MLDPWYSSCLCCCCWPCSCRRYRCSWCLLRPNCCCCLCCTYCCWNPFSYCYFQRILRNTEGPIENVFNSAAIYSGWTVPLIFISAAIVPAVVGVFWCSSCLLCCCLHCCCRCFLCLWCCCRPYCCWRPFCAGFSMFLASMLLLALASLLLLMSLLLLAFPI